MIEPRLLARKPRLDLAQADRTRKLAKQERQELALGGQPAHPAIGLVLIHKLLEHAPRNMLLNLVKDAIVMPHDIDPLFVSRPSRNA